MKKCFFKRLYWRSWQKSFPTNKNSQKNCKIWFFNFRQKTHLDVVLVTSKQKFWIIQIILKLFCRGNFFHTTISFCCKSPRKSLFWRIFEFLTKNRQNSQFSKKYNFQGLLQLKLMVVQKTILGQKRFKIIRKRQNFCLKVAKTTSMWFFWRKSKNLILPFGAIFY